jgi:predicted nucleic acid-binding protein
MAKAKTQIYFDTSAVSRLFDSGIRLKPEIEAVNELLRLIDERKKWLAVVSPVFVMELADAPEEKQKLMVDALERFSIENLPYDAEAETLTNAYINGGVLSAQHSHDLMHIAYATLYKCRYLVSCDTQHVARVQTQTRVEMVNKSLRHATPQIFEPLKLLEIIR